jgi:prephenate dehydratase
MKIGISGAQGSFTEAAAKLYILDNRIPETELVYLTFVENVLESLEKGEIDLGVFAIENSNGGVVTEYLPAIGAHRFGIQKIFEMKVEHMLLVRPGTTAAKIKKIVSQNQALRQCRMYIKRVWPDAEVIEYIDTATAAKDLHEGTLGDDVAVVAPQAAADLYGLEVLEAGIQDLKFNFTTFIAATRLG